jgi:hypothetical protein
MTHPMTQHHKELTQEELKTLLIYDPAKGTFHRIKHRNRPCKPFPIGWPNDKGYTHIYLKGKTYMATHLAILYMTGTLPPGEVRFRDKDKSNLRYSNLMPGHAWNKSGHKIEYLD